MKRRLAWFLASLIGLLAIFLLVTPQYVVPDREQLLPKARFDAENDVRDLVLKALTGAGLLVTLYYTARTFRLSTQGLRLHAEEQTTERLTRAVEQLGDDAPAVRMGGVYGLGRIAAESDEERVPIVLILVAHLRQRGAISGGSNRIAQDVQAALTVLNRRVFADEWEKVKRRGDFTALELGDANLAYAALNNGDFRRCRLDDAYLYWADFSNADLRDSSLRRTALISTQLSGADLRGADLTNADLHGAVFHGADLRGAVLTGAAIVAASLHGARADDSTAWPEEFDPEQAPFRRLASSFNRHEKAR